MNTVKLILGDNMDATYTSVIRLWEQECSLNEICRRLNLSKSKVRKILITSGYIETDESKMLKDGLTVREIAAILDKTENAVQGRIPYSKGMYDQEYPSVNVLRIRKCREKKVD